MSLFSFNKDRLQLLGSDIQSYSFLNVQTLISYTSLSSFENISKAGISLIMYYNPEQ